MLRRPFLLCNVKVDSDHAKEAEDGRKDLHQLDHARHFTRQQSGSPAASAYGSSSRAPGLPSSPRCENGADANTATGRLTISTVAEIRTLLSIPWRLRQ